KRTPRMRRPRGPGSRALQTQTLAFRRNPEQRNEGARRTAGRAVLVRRNVRDASGAEAYVPVVGGRPAVSGARAPFQKRPPGTTPPARRSRLGSGPRRDPNGGPQGSELVTGMRWKRWTRARQLDNLRSWFSS